jgi:two-component system, NarL family, response regulator
MTDAAFIRVLVADDHAVVRAGVRGMLSLSPHIAVVAEAATGPETVDLFHRHRPDVTVLDLRMPGMSGVEVMKAIRAEWPGARFVALSNCDGEQDVYQAVEAGAQAYHFKTVAADDLIATVEAVHAGEKRFDEAVSARLGARMAAPLLSPRELEVLQLMAQGASTDAIASALDIAHNTVKVHVRNILAKLRTDNRTGAVATALQRGIIHLD